MYAILSPTVDGVLCGDNSTQASNFVFLDIGLDDTHVVLQCEARYLGFYAPVLAWYDNEGNLVDNTTIDDPANYRVSSQINVTDLHPGGRTVTCLTYFSDPDPADFPPDDPVARIRYDVRAPVFENECVIQLGVGVYNL